MTTRIWATICLVLAVIVNPYTVRIVFASYCGDDLETSRKAIILLFQFMTALSGLMLIRPQKTRSFFVRHKKLFFSIILLFLILGLFELFSMAALYVFSEYKHIHFKPVLKNSISEITRTYIQKALADDSSYYRYDPYLGWSIKPMGQIRFDADDNGEPAYDYHANSIGIRANREYPLQPEPGKIRISTFGDSFTHCDEVDDLNTWQQQLQQLDTSLEVVNAGCGGYGLDQALLKYYSLRKLIKSDIVLIGYMTENINRNINTFRPFYYSDTNMPFSKPVFTLEDHQLRYVRNVLDSREKLIAFLDNPTPFLVELEKNDYHYHWRSEHTWLDASSLVKLGKTLKQEFGDDYIYRSTSQPWQLTLSLFQQFFTQVHQDNALAVVVMIASKPVFQSPRYRSRYAAFFKDFESRGILFINLADEMQSMADQDIDGLFQKQGHYSSQGNALVARIIHNYLINKQLLDENARRLWIEKSQSAQINISNLNDILADVSIPPASIESAGNQP